MSGVAPAKPPLEARQYLLTLVLLGMGVWCVYDGWFNPEIESVWFNRLLGPPLILAGIWDGLRMRRREIEAAQRKLEAQPTSASEDAEA